MNATELYKAAQKFGEDLANERELHTIESKTVLAFDNTGNPRADYPTFKAWASSARQQFGGLSKMRLPSEPPPQRTPTPPPAK